MNVFVIGDIMIDINYHCITNRKAPEANIPIYNVIDTDYILGGAANVANNLKNLDCNVTIISVIGEDIMGNKIKELFNQKNINHKLFIENNRKTTQKNRLFYNNNLITRYDIEDIYDINYELENEIYDYINTNINNIDAIIISDYDKGVLTLNLCKNIIDYSNKNNIYTFVDPKIKNYLKYQNCFCFKPNLLEGQIISNTDNINNIFNFIYDNIKCSNLILTNGEHGLYVNSINNIISHDDKIITVDVTGAGDIVMSVLCYIYIKYKDIMLAAKIANYIAGLSVRVIGNYNVSIEDINKYLIQNNINININNKILYDYNIDKIKELSKYNTVFTNGCFDIIHSAHVKLLQFAKTKGDILVVGLNSDESIKQLKGPTRPINDISERSELLASLGFIDYIIIFNDLTPFNIIKLLKPKILIKGGDYKKEDIIGKEFVEEICLFDFVKNKSSTIVINKILDK